MIQRIQTLYLLLVVILGTVLLFMPVVQLVTPADAALQRMWILGATGFTELTTEVAAPAVVLNGWWGLSVATALIPLLALVDIFLFKKRILQARLNIFTVMLCLGWYGVLAIMIWFAKMNMEIECSILAWSCIPAICLILTLMATRAILKDEALVRAADRLR